ncbi:hypothetical protein [Streptomyces sp. ICBB 8177]|uniref:hypothetical protein n=1 Tax=Streptomyces sp. ICBB 8177 TaxID=563922 RepID=UPI0018EE85D7|nr:hypothetical protein [Streptomyces sp. ICBB 8177]
MARRRTDLVKADAHHPAPSDTLLDEPRDESRDEPRNETGGEPTAVLATMDDAGVVATAVEPVTDPESVLAEPPDARDISAELAAPPRRKLPWLTLALSGAVVAALAFAGGALVEKSDLNGSGHAGGTFAAGARGATGTGSGTGAYGAAGRFGGSGASAGAGRSGSGSGSGLTMGTVKLVDGSTIYVTDAQGDIVKVTTGKSTQVTEAKPGRTSDLQPGQTVTVRGTQDSSGDIAATTVTEGASTGFGGGGFGGGGFGGGGGTGAGASGGGNG